MNQFRCGCGAVYADLGEFHDHALPCWERRRAAQEAETRAGRIRAANRARSAASRGGPVAQPPATPAPTPTPAPPLPAFIPEHQETRADSARHLLAREGREARKQRRAAERAAWARKAS